MTLTFTNSSIFSMRRCPLSSTQCLIKSTAIECLKKIIDCISLAKKVRQH